MHTYQSTLPVSRSASYTVPAKPLSRRFFSDKVAREDAEAEPTRFRNEAQESLEQSFTPSLARRLSRTLIEQTRRSLTRSPSASYDSRGQSPGSEAADRSLSTVSDQTEYKERPAFGVDRWYKEPGFVGRSSAGKLRKESFRAYRADKIQEEAPDDRNESIAENGSVSEHTYSASICDATSSLSAKSYETSPTESSSNIADYKPAYKSDSSRNFEDRLLAAENLIKESKLRNLGHPTSGKLDPNLSSSYRDTDKCDKRSLTSITEPLPGSALSKRRSCIPSLRLRSGSLTREATSAFSERRKSVADPRHVAARAFSPERSLLSKLFKSASTREADSREGKEDAQKSKQRRISRFLRPDFFDTPREESRYAKEKEAQKAAENERRKSRFIRRKTESVEQEKKREKELKNEINSLKRERRSREIEERAKSESPDEGSRNGFLHSLEKKLERLRSADGQPESEPAGSDAEKAKGKKKKKEKPISCKANGKVEGDALRERSAPPVVDCRPANDCQAAAKRAASVEDLSPASKSSQPSSRSRVSSVLGLFKTTDAKHPANGTRPRAAVLMNKLKRTSPTKSTTASVDEGSGSSNGGGGTSKIPTKHASPDLKSTKPAKPSSASKSPKSSPPKDVAGEKGPEEKLADRNGEEESGRSIGKGKKSSRSMENGSAATEAGNPEDAERKARKPTKKLGGSAESGDVDGARKKRIVRVTKKVTKKGSSDDAAAVGDGSRVASEEQEKDKSTKARATRKKSGIAEANGAAISSRAGKAKENGVGARSSGTAEETIAPEAKSGQPPKQQQQQEPHRASRSNLKLDLSKIPQHSFRYSAPKSDSPRAAASDRSPDKPTVAHRAVKAATEKPLRAKDVAELKREVTECARIIESHADSATVAPAAEEPAEEPAEENQTASCLPKQLSSDRASELLSPTADEAESFDSWSISSADLSHARPDLHSPTSPSPSLSARGDESVIDRIRRRSFYSRFNDRRKSSLTAPPPGVSLPSSATLPRKFSLTGLHRDHHQQRDRGKYAAGYGSTASAKPDQVVARRPIDRSYSLYGDGSVAVARNRSLDRGLYSSSYDPLRRYLLRSPTFDLAGSRSRYHSADFAADSDLASCSSCYRSSHSSLLSDATIDSSAYSTLPRKYGASFSEPKTVEYYEELLAPSSADYYLSPRRSPASSEYRKPSVEPPGTIRCERTAASEAGDDDDDDSKEEKRGEGGAGKETGSAPSMTARPGQ